MDSYLQNTGGAIDEQSHLARILYRFDAANLILINNKAAGLLKYYRDKSCWVIVQVQLAPEHQGKGLGAKILNNLLAQATREGKAVTLSVLKGNPAIHLYRRLGFVVASESDSEYSLCFTPKIN
ncbi:GNAT family N-acetyltransferase [Thalassomonas sp. RHCl1]|uniref:GNAT family N-acetyltransferase n=1 Tax=Thalassomonas sp. RHCl1 TaxID=2995320 RepID=UPI00248C80B6|nr:GNAT family N-acetyltransferase [Thalassomonas sp. RHCl1]